MHVTDGNTMKAGGWANSYRRRLTSKLRVYYRSARSCLRTNQRRVLAKPTAPAGDGAGTK